MNFGYPKFEFIASSVIFTIFKLKKSLKSRAMSLCTILKHSIRSILEMGGYKLPNVLCKINISDYPVFLLNLRTYFILSISVNF